MQTKNDVLYFLNELDFTDNINDTDFENLTFVKRILVKELEGYNIPKLIYVLSIVDNLFITITVVGLKDILNKTNTLREFILYLIIFEHFVNKNEYYVIKITRQNGFIFNQKNKLTIKFCSNLSHIKIHYYSKLQIPIMHRHFFRKLSENREIVQTHCYDRRNLFHFACHDWYLYKNPQGRCSIL